MVHHLVSQMWLGDIDCKNLSAGYCVKYKNLPYTILEEVENKKVSEELKINKSTIDVENTENSTKFTFFKIKQLIDKPCIKIVNAKDLKPFKQLKTLWNGSYHSIEIGMILDYQDDDGRWYAVEVIPEKEEELNKGRYDNEKEYVGFYFINLDIRKTVCYNDILDNQRLALYGAYSFINVKGEKDENSNKNNHNFINEKDKDSDENSCENSDEYNNEDENSDEDINKKENNQHCKKWNQLYPCYFKETFHPLKINDIIYYRTNYKYSWQPGEIISIFKFEDHVYYIKVYNEDTHKCEWVENRQCNCMIYHDNDHQFCKLSTVRISDERIDEVGKSVDYLFHFVLFLMVVGAFMFCYYLPPAYYQLESKYLNLNIKFSYLKDNYDAISRNVYQHIDNLQSQLNDVKDIYQKQKLQLEYPHILNNIWNSFIKDKNMLVILLFYSPVFMLWLTIIAMSIHALFHYFLF